MKLTSHMTSMFECVYRTHSSLMWSGHETSFSSPLSISVVPCPCFSSCLPGIFCCGCHGYPYVFPSAVLIVHHPCHLHDHAERNGRGGEEVITVVCHNTMTAIGETVGNWFVLQLMHSKLDVVVRLLLELLHSM